MTSVELTEEEAKQFVLFRQHQTMFQAIIEAKLQELKRGEAVLSFNHDGHLMQIEIRRMAYRKKV